MAINNSPLSSTGISPFEMLTGKPPRNPTVDVQGLMRNMPMHVQETRRQMIKQRQEQKEKLQSMAKGVVNTWRREEEFLQPGDRVFIHTQRPQQEANRLGIPAKWIYKWDQQGTIVGPVEGHPFQYLVKKDRTGNVIKRSLADLKKHR